MMGYIGKGEIIGLETIFSTEGRSLFTYQVSSAEFEYYQMYSGARKRFFNQFIELKTYLNLLKLLEYRLNYILKKTNLRKTKEKRKLEEGENFEISEYYNLTNNKGLIEQLKESSQGIKTKPEQIETFKEKMKGIIEDEAEILKQLNKRDKLKRKLELEQKLMDLSKDVRRKRALALKKKDDDPITNLSHRSFKRFIGGKSILGSPNIKTSRLALATQRNHNRQLSMTGLSKYNQMFLTGCHDHKIERVLNFISKSVASNSQSVHKINPEESSLLGGYLKKKSKRTFKKDSNKEKGSSSKVEFYRKKKQIYKKRIKPRIRGKSLHANGGSLTNMKANPGKIILSKDNKKSDQANFKIKIVRDWPVVEKPTHPKSSARKSMDLPIKEEFKQFK